MQEIIPNRYWFGLSLHSHFLYMKTGNSPKPTALKDSDSLQIPKVGIEPTTVEMKIRALAIHLQ